MSRRLVRTPEPPYLAVIFTSVRSDDQAGYLEVAGEMERLAAEQNGYLGHEVTRNRDGLGIPISYWRDADAISAWRANAKHKLARKLGNERWYDEYEMRIARVERAYSGPRTLED